MPSTTVLVAIAVAQSAAAAPPAVCDFKHALSALEDWKSAESFCASYVSPFVAPTKTKTATVFVTPTDCTTITKTRTVRAVSTET